MNLIKTEENRIEIQLSKLKLTLLLFIGVAFVIGGIFFIVSPSSFTEGGFRHTPKNVLLIVGFACVIFFGVGVIISIIRFFDNKPGLLIDNAGVTINPGSSSNSFIKWGDIEKFGIISISRTKLIVIYLKHPEQFIDNLTSPFKRKMASFSLKRYGTPICITTSTLKCESNELYRILTERLNGKN